MCCITRVASESVLVGGCVCINGTRGWTNERVGVPRYFFSVVVEEPKQHIAGGPTTNTSTMVPLTRRESSRLSGTGTESVNGVSGMYLDQILSNFEQCTYRQATVLGHQ